MSSDTTRDAGLKILKTIEATDTPSIIASLRDVAPDLADLAISFAYGQVYARPGLTLLQRQMATVAMLAAVGGLEPQLKFHLRGALNVGASAAQLVEVMTHLVVYAGFPAALNGVAALRDILQPA
ncbi:carboxymuconolactone decarboxylase family protein [Ideonella azotifigens]|nr:carboxymuconolactone decarboxylase family protein [Ideonella azotifigens]MCD2339527.1 carboxymuconolactone decarboxylase family protein [Ideonella azotifigens]